MRTIVQRTIFLVIAALGAPLTAQAQETDGLAPEITNFAWQDDVSGLPKSAAGSSMRTRYMLKEWERGTRERGNGVRL